MSSRKFCRSKHKFPTHIVKGTGNQKGFLVLGWQDALKNVESALGRSLRNPQRKNNKFLWVFEECV